MKNLKKVLALVLVVAMMASFAVGASAAFKDADKITYTTAVDVLTGLGVINGYADGTFRATDSVTRGAFTKMVAYVMNGGKNAPASYGAAAAAALTDVKADSTFGPSIGFCTSKGIISGYSDKTFRAGNKVTGVQGAKMLLGALGYSSDIEGYTGSKWSMNVLNDAEEAGLFKGMATVDLTQPLTREAASQMIWNALQATMVKYANGGVSITTPDGTQVSTGASAAAPVTTTEDYGRAFSGETAVTGGSYTVQLVEKYFPAIKTADNNYRDALGRPGVEYKLGTKTLATATKTPAVTYTSAVTGAKVLKDLGIKTEQTAVTVYTTGTKSADATIKTSDGKLATSGNGVVTEVYVKNDAVSDIIYIVPTYTNATTVATQNATKSHGARTVYTVGGNAYYVYSSVVDADKDVNTAVVTGTVNNKTAVYYYVDNQKVAHITALESVSGNVTSYSSATQTYTIGGKAYALAEAATSELKTKGIAVNGKEQSFYVDEYGYIVDGVAAAPVNPYGMLVSLDQTVTLNGNKLEYSYSASVAGADGTVQAYAISADNYKAYTDGATKLAVPSIVKYEQEKGKTTYTLTAQATTTATINTGKTTVTGLDGYVNANTKFVFANFGPDGKANGTVNVVTGAGNVANYTDVAAYATKTGSVIDVVYVISNKSATTTIKSLVYVTGSYTLNTDGTYTLEAYVDGVQSDITGAKGALAEGLYSSVTTDSTGTAGVLAGKEATNPLTSYTKVQYMNGLIIATTTTAEGISADDSTPVYTIDTTDHTIASSTAEGLNGEVTADSIFVLKDAKGAATAIYLVNVKD